MIADSSTLQLTSLQTEGREQLQIGGWWHTSQDQLKSARDGCLYRNQFVLKSNIQTRRACGATRLTMRLACVSSSAASKCFVRAPVLPSSMPSKCPWSSASPATNPAAHMHGHRQGVGALKQSFFGVTSGKKEKRDEANTEAIQ